MGPIPWLAVVRYAEVYDIDLDQLADLSFHVQHLDGVYLEWQNQQTESKA